MKLFKFLKKEEKVEIEKPKQLDRLAVDNAIRQHQGKIDNLNEELIELTNNLEFIELDFNAPKAKREKDSDTIIRRMSIIKYEIEIRKGLVKWLS